MQSVKSRGLTLIPPSPVSCLTPVEFRAGLVNDGSIRHACRVSFYLDDANEDQCLYSTSVHLEPGAAVAAKFLWHPDVSHAGEHLVILKVHHGDKVWEYAQPLMVVDSKSRSLDIIAGAFSGFCHWSETEGRLWNDELRTFTEDDWRALVRAQYEAGMSILVPQETFRNQCYVGEHHIEMNGYHGAACYDSALYSKRMNIATPDPLQVTLDEADKLGMQVFVPVGMYAWFDFSKGSLKWHKEVAAELWSRYGHHSSFYGWYVSEEIAGDLGTDEMRREELIHFFREFKSHCVSLAPEKPLMLATNCHHVQKGSEYYPRLLEHLDILCPFGFQRMPEDDISADDAAAYLQGQCDAAGAHLWLDMEVFNFHPDMALYPRPIEEIVAELNRRQSFEKIICYQFPGMFNAEWAEKRPGGAETVYLYNSYRHYVATELPQVLPKKAAVASVS